MYARGMTVREIQGHLEDIYAVEVSPDLISSVTDSVLEEVKAWQNRPLDAVDPIVFMDALRVKIRDNGHVVSVSRQMNVDQSCKFLRDTYLPEGVFL